MSEQELHAEMARITELLRSGNATSKDAERLVKIRTILRKMKGTSLACK